MDKEKEAQSQYDESLQAGISESPTLEWMVKNGVPLTRANFIEYNWGVGTKEKDLEGEQLAQIPDCLTV